MQWRFEIVSYGVEGVQCFVRSAQLPGPFRHPLLQFLCRPLAVGDVADKRQDLAGGGKVASAHVDIKSCTILPAVLGLKALKLGADYLLEVPQHLLGRFAAFKVSNAYPQ